MRRAGGLPAGRRGPSGGGGRPGGGRRAEGGGGIRPVRRGADPAVSRGRIPETRLKNPKRPVEHGGLTARDDRRNTVRIGIIGAGHIGSTLARHFAGIGHDVAIANSRGPETLKGLVSQLSGSVRAVTAEEAARFGEVVVVTIPYGRFHELPAAELRDKIVVDTCNYYAERDGHDAELDADATTSSEKVQKYTGADVVKAFNAIYWQNLRDHGRPKGDPDRLAIPISGGDEEAKAVVAGLIRDIGFDPVDAGRLGQGGRKHQPGSRVYTVELSAPELTALLQVA
ncbi:NAD(P)-binding domain-containing protein [Streptomyces sp. NBC_00138]